MHLLAICARTGSIVLGTMTYIHKVCLQLFKVCLQLIRYVCSMALWHGNTQHIHDLCRPLSVTENNSVNSPSTATILIPSFSALATTLLGCSRTTNNQHLQQQKNNKQITFTTTTKTISIQFSPRWYLRA